MTHDSNDSRDVACRHCGFADEMKHQDEHAGLCCGCMDLSCGMSLDKLNAERIAAGKPPITKPWPVRS